MVNYKSFQSYDAQRTDFIKESDDDSSLDLFSIDLNSIISMIENISIENNTSVGETHGPINSRFQYNSCLASVENTRFASRKQKVGRLIDANEPMV